MRRNHPGIDTINGQRPARVGILVASAVVMIANPGCSQPAREANQAVDEGSTTQAELPNRAPTDSPPPSTSLAPAESLTDSPPVIASPQPPTTDRASTTPDGSRREIVLQRFITNYGRENVVVIRVSHADRLQPGVLARQLAHDLGEEHRFATRPSSDAIIALLYAGDIEDVVARIDWGTVTSTDRAERLILVDGRQVDAVHSADSAPSVDGVPD